MEKINYTTVSLPTSLVEEMKIWQLAFNASYGRPVSFEEMIRGMLDSLEDSEPGVVDELDKIMKKHPELMEKMSDYLRKSSN